MLDTLFLIMLGILGTAIFITFLLAAVAYWRFTLFVVGVILVNAFTFWSAIIVFFLAVILQSYSHMKEKTFTVQLFVSEILKGSAIVTFAVIAFSLVASAVFGVLGGGGSGCSRAMPGGC